MGTLARVFSRVTIRYLFRPHLARAMSSPVPIAPETTASNPPAMGAPALAALRLELDGIDDALHDLLMRRAGIVARIGAVAAKGRVALRPGREASIIRRLLARNHPPLPAQAVARIWRELLAATTGMQGGHAVAVCERDPAGAYTQVAREHFGALTPTRVHHGAAQAMAELSAGTASVAVLPMPTEDESPRDAWWTVLLPKDDPRIHVVARLPFWSPRPEGAPRVQALVVSAIAPDPSGRDRSLLGLELARDASRARIAGALVAAGLPPESVILRRDPGAEFAHALADVEGLIADDDLRLGAIAGVLHRPVVLGSYAVPEE
jgi:chorismate mutase